MPTLTPAELHALHTQLQDYAPGQAALTQLQQHQGELALTLEAALMEQFGPPQQMGDRTLWQVTKQQVRQELCEQEGFLGKIKAYIDKPGDAGMLTAAIGYVVAELSIAVSPLVATLIVLYVAKVGLGIFCEYTKPEEAES